MVQSFPEQERRAGKDQVEEVTQKGNGVTSGSGEFKVPGQHSVETPTPQEKWNPSLGISRGLEEPHLLSPKPQGLLAKCFPP